MEKESVSHIYTLDKTVSTWRVSKPGSIIGSHVSDRIVMSALITSPGVLCSFGKLHAGHQSIRFNTPLFADFTKLFPAYVLRKPISVRAKTKSRLACEMPSLEDNGPSKRTVNGRCLHVLFSWNLCDQSNDAPLGWHRHTWTATTPKSMSHLPLVMWLCAVTRKSF